MSQTVLALDLATKTGYACGKIGQRCMMHGAIRFAPPGASRAHILVGAMTWITSKIRTLKPDIVIFESPIPAMFMGRKTSFNTTRILYGLCGIVEAVCLSHNILKIADLNVSSVRKNLLGTTYRGKEAKEEVKKFIISSGYIPEDDNAADALMLWIYFNRFYGSVKFDSK